MSSHQLIDMVRDNLAPFISSGHRHFLLGCSGGADSTALLKILHLLSTSDTFQLSVVTVNHNIREHSISLADTQYVEAVCAQLSPPIPCYTEQLPEGAVTHCAQTRKKGVEDAARFLRYDIFNRTADSIGANYIITAHNKNDTYETLLMRLFQGAGTESLQLMQVQRGRYLRPLITVDRAEIEDFLHCCGLAWCEDHTNAEMTYLRNRIRHVLVPALVTVFGTSWQSGLHKTVQRIGLDAAFCTETLNRVRKDTDTGANLVQCKHTALKLSAAFFHTLSSPLRLRIIEEACIRLNIDTRIPFTALYRFAAADAAEKIVECAQLRMEQRSSFIFLFKVSDYLALYSKKSYCLTVDHAGSYPYPLGIFTVYTKNGGYFLRDHDDTGAGIGPLHLPFIVRGRKAGDTIMMKNGRSKTVKKIFNEWALDSLMRELLPIVVEGGSLRGLYGHPFGYDNWIVSETAV